MPPIAQLEGLQNAYLQTQRLNLLLLRPRLALAEVFLADLANLIVLI